MPSYKVANASKVDGQNSLPGKESGNITAPKRDFFGRIIKDDECQLDKTTGRRQNTNLNGRAPGEKGGGKIFVSFHEGYSNAVRKPITLDDLMRGL